MAESGKTKHPASAAADYDEHLRRAEDHLEAGAAKSESSFREHTAGAAAKLQEAEDKADAAARKAEKR